MCIPFISTEKYGKREREREEKKKQCAQPTTRREISDSNLLRRDYPFSVEAFLDAYLLLLEIEYLQLHHTHNLIKA